MPDILLNHLYTGNLQKTDSYWLDLQKLLDAGTRKRIQKNRNRRQQINSLCSKLMLYHMANDCIGKVSPSSHPLRYSTKGYPSLMGIPLSISISYQGDWVTVAISHNVRIGIDVESVERNVKFKQIPLNWRRKLERINIKTWNELEAYAKLWGHGLSILFSKPLPYDSSISFTHLPVSYNIDCCVASAGVTNIKQYYVQWDDIAYSFKNAID
ncbi:MAG: hypothetical protein R2795_13590 [Saprospiraceae bacterium]